MKSRPPHRIAALMTLGCALLPGQAARALKQDEPSAVTILLSRARTLEQRGRLDLAQQDWSQVLLADPNDAEALAGLARAAKAEGRSGDADKYLGRLRAAHPGSPELTQAQNANKGPDTSVALAEAAKLSRAGEARAAMVLYRRVYGVNPPPGTPALTYYETEAATEDRPQAIAGLRALSDRYPTDLRYQVALGRVLLGSPRTRAEGRTILEGLPGDAEAVAALRGASPGGEHGVPATASADRATETASLPAGAHSAARAQEGASQSANQRTLELKATGTETKTAAAHPSASPEVPSRTAGARGLLVTAPVPGRRDPYLAEEQAAFAALNGHRTAEAEQIFHSILSRDPRDARALAGMGYLRGSVGDLKSAVMFFQQAQESGDHSLALTRAMVNAQFELALKQAGTARAKGDLPAAEVQYRTALRERPNDPDALEGLGGTLLQGWRFGDAIPVFDKLTHVRPMDPAAWRGLVVADASAGRGNAALAADTQVPQAVRNPLSSDQSYQRALSVARESQGTQVARVEPPPSPRPPSPTPPVTVTAPPSPPPPAAVPSKPSPAVVPPKPMPPVAPPAAVAKNTPPAARGHQPPVTAPPPAAVPAETPGSGVPAAAASTAPLRAPGTLASQPAPGASDAEGRQQADYALLHGHNAEAALMFRGLASRFPERPDGWRGLVLALHNQGHEAEAAVVLERIPPGARVVLDRDASFQTAAGAVFLANNQPSEALRALARAQEVFSSQRLTPPIDLVMQTARLLAARGDDENLYRELMYLGERRDLTDVRRMEVQMIWTRWAVRRARALSAAGDDERAVTLLNAAATAFAGSTEVLHAVADGYAGIGKPREAVALYRTQDLTAAPAVAIEHAVGAATNARDYRTAEAWMRIGLQRFGSDPQMLNQAAELAQARGREKRAEELSQQAKALAPAQNPGQVLAAELREAPAGSGWAGRASGGGQLGVLLAPADVAGAQMTKPYLPAVAGPVHDSASVAGSEQPPVLAGYDEPSR